MKNSQIRMALTVVAITLFLNVQGQSNKTTAQTEVTPKAGDTQPATGHVKSKHGHILISEIPTQKHTATKAEVVDGGVAKAGIRGNEIIGEGEYLNFDKVIMQRSITGQIPEGFPKHVKGQTKEEYKKIMMDWARNHTEFIKDEYRNEIK